MVRNQLPAQVVNRKRKRFATNTVGAKLHGAALTFRVGLFTRETVSQTRNEREGRVNGRTASSGTMGRRMGKDGG